MINCIGFFFFSITEHADVKKELKPRALCIDNIYVNVRLIKTLLWLFWSLFLEIMQINWSLWKVADAMFEVPEDQKKKKKQKTGMLQLKKLHCEVFFLNYY